MTRMSFIIQLIFIAFINALTPVANAQEPLIIPKIDRELVKGLELGSAGKGSSWQVPTTHPKDDKSSTALTPEQAAELKKLRGDRELPAFQPPVITDERFNPYEFKGSEEAKALLDKLPARDPDSSLKPDVSTADASEKKVGAMSDAEREAHEEILKEGFGSSETIWTRVVDDIYKDDRQNSIEINRLKRILFADYLGYLNAIGLELASYEITLKASREMASSGKCSSATAEEYEQNLIDSVQSDLDTFTRAYCNNVCKDQSYFLERAKFAAPEGVVESCSDKARKIFDQFNCNELGQNSRVNTTSALTSMVDGATSPGSDLVPSRFDTTESNGVKQPSLPTLPGLNSSISADSSADELLNIDQSLLTSKLAFESVLQKQKTNCKRLEYIKSRTIWAAPTGEERTLFNVSNGYNSNDPRWTTPSENTERAPEPIASVVPKNNTCETDKVDADHFQKLRSEYQRISYRKIAESLADWPLLDENDNIKKDYLRLILKTSDQLFLPLIDDLEGQYNEFCGAGSSSLIADTTVGQMNHGGRKLDIVIKANVDDLNKEPEPEKSKEDRPETLASHFNQTSSLMDGFLDAILLGSDQTGPATIPEFRGAEIARAVLDGKLRPEDIATEAAKGPTGRLAQDIVKQTEKYLANGQYQGFKLFAVQLAGGAVTGGGLAIGTVVKESIERGLESGTVGAFSKVLQAARKIIMKPMLPGGQTGAIGAKFETAEMLAKRLGVSKDVFHNKVKKDILKQFGKELSESGFNKNPDIGINGLGHIIFRDRITNKTFETTTPLDFFRWD